MTGIQQLSDTLFLDFLVILQLVALFMVSGFRTVGISGDFPPAVPRGARGLRQGHPSPPRSFPNSSTRCRGHRASDRFLQLVLGPGAFAVLVEVLQMVNHRLRAAEQHQSSAKSMTSRQVSSVSRRAYEIVRLRYTPTTVYPPSQTQ